MTDERTLSDRVDTQATATTAVLGSEAVITEALGVIDDALARMMSRELVSSGEVADLLLDVRSLLTTDTAV